MCGCPRAEILKKSYKRWGGFFCSLMYPKCLTGRGAPLQPGCPTLHSSFRLLCPSFPRLPPAQGLFLGVVSGLRKRDVPSWLFLVVPRALLSVCTPVESSQPSPMDPWSLRLWPPQGSEWAPWLLPAEKHVLGSPGLNYLRLNRCSQGPSQSAAPACGTLLDTSRGEVSTQLIWGRRTGRAYHSACFSERA